MSGGDRFFHLTDCLDDLEGLAAWVRDPHRGDEDEAVALIGIFRTFPHLDAAGRRCWMRSGRVNPVTPRRLGDDPADPLVFRREPE